MSIRSVLNHPSFARWFFTGWGVLAAFFVGMGIGQNRTRPVLADPRIVMGEPQPRGTAVKYRLKTTGEIVEAWQVNVYDKRNAPAWVFDHCRWADTHGVDMIVTATGWRVRAGDYLVLATESDGRERLFVVPGLEFNEKHEVVR